MFAFVLSGFRSLGRLCLKTLDRIDPIVRVVTGLPFRIRVRKNSVRRADTDSREASFRIKKWSFPAFVLTEKQSVLLTKFGHSEIVDSGAVDAGKRIKKQDRGGDGGRGRYAEVEEGLHDRKTLKMIEKIELNIYDVYVASFI